MTAPRDFARAPIHNPFWPCTHREALDSSCKYMEHLHWLKSVLAMRSGMFFGLTELSKNGKGKLSRPPHKSVQFA